MKKILLFFFLFNTLSLVLVAPTKSVYACKVGSGGLMLVGEQWFIQVNSDAIVEPSKYQYNLSYLDPVTNTQVLMPQVQQSGVPDEQQFDSGEDGKRAWFAFSPRTVGVYDFVFERRNTLPPDPPKETCTSSQTTYTTQVRKRCCPDGTRYLSSAQCLVQGAGCYNIDLSGGTWCVSGTTGSPACTTCENFDTGARKLAVCRPDYAPWFNKGISCDQDTSGVYHGVDTAIGCVPIDNLTKFLSFVLKWAFFASGGIILLLIISTGYTIITSSGNPEKLQGAQENIVALFSGLALIAFSLVLLQAIGADILNLSAFK